MQSGSAGATEVGSHRLHECLQLAAIHPALRAHSPTTEKLPGVAQNWQSSSRSPQPARVVVVVVVAVILLAVVVVVAGCLVVVGSERVMCDEMMRMCDEM